MLAPAGGESAGASVNTDWSAMNAVETDPAEAVASETTVAPTASEVALFAAIEAPTYEPDAVETEPAHAEAGVRRQLWQTARRQSLGTLTVRRDKRRVRKLRRYQSQNLQGAKLRTLKLRRRNQSQFEYTESPGVSPQQSTAQWMGLAAAAVIAVAAMGVPLGVWLGTRHQAQPEPRQAAAPGVQKAAVGGSARPGSLRADEGP